MATPAVLPPATIVYKSRGVVIDTQLVVFDTTFHLSSTVVKMNSQFFDIYLDLADKAPQSNAGRVYKYEWVTKILEDGEDWQPVCDGTNAGELNMSASKLDAEGQTKAFKNILDAMYQQPYILGHAKEILTMTNLAQFYMALPPVSRSLDKALDHSCYNLDQNWIRDNAWDMLTAANALRHKQLYKNALLWCLGPFEDPACYKLKDRSLLMAARCQYFKLSSIILRKFQTIFVERIKEYNEPLPDDDPDSLSIRMAVDFIKSTDKHISEEGHGSLNFPALFQTLSGMKAKRYLELIAKYALESLVESDLSSGFGEVSCAGYAECKDYFLISTIDGDLDLPWDPKETDW